VHVNNIFESYLSNLYISGTCSASKFTIGYGTNNNVGYYQTITEPLEMPVFHDKLIQDARAHSMEFKPSDFPDNLNYPFPGQTGFNIRCENGTTFVITGAGTFNINSSMYFQGNLQLSVPYTVNTGSNFIVADGFIKLEGHDLNTDELDENSINTNTNILNVYSIHGKIMLSTERSKIYGILYAAGVPSPQYTTDVGLVLLQGMNNTVYGSIVAGSDIRLEGSNTKIVCTPVVNTRVITKYFPNSSLFPIKQAAKQLVEKYKGTDTIIRAFHYSDMATPVKVGSNDAFDVSNVSNASSLQTAIEEIAENDNGYSNMGDALRQAYQSLEASSPDVTKYIVVFAASAPNKWTSENSSLTVMKTTTGPAVYVGGDGAADADNKSFNYAKLMGENIRTKNIEPIFINVSSTDISSKLEQIAVAAGSKQLPDGKYTYKSVSLVDLPTIYKTILLKPATKVVLEKVKYEELYPAGVKVITPPPGTEIIPVQVNGVTRDKVKGELQNVTLTYDGTNYKIEDYTIKTKVRYTKPGIITISGDDTKLEYNLEYLDTNGEPQNVNFTKKFDDITVNVIMVIDIG